MRRVLFLALALAISSAMRRLEEFSIVVTNAEERSTLSHQMVSRFLARLGRNCFVFC